MKIIAGRFHGTLSSRNGPIYVENKLGFVLTAFRKRGMKVAACQSIRLANYRSPYYFLKQGKYVR